MPGQSEELYKFDRSPTKQSDLDRQIMSIVSASIIKSNPYYLQFIDNGNSETNILSSIIIAALNQNMTSHMSDSPEATFIEFAVIRHLRELAGFPTRPFDSIYDIGGAFVPGGMTGNMAAVLLARNRMFPDAQLAGLGDRSMSMIVGKNSSHYSNWFAMGWLGLGENQVIHCPVNEFQLDPEIVEQVIIERSCTNSPVGIVVATLGEPFGLNVQRISGLREVCDRNGVWLHGDGANGGAAIFSTLKKDILPDTELLDSLSLDPHKGLGLTYPCSVFLSRQFEDINTLIRHWNIINRPGSRDLGAISPFTNSRGFDSFKLWYLLKTLGTEGLADLIDNKIAYARKLHEMLERHDKVVVLSNCDLFSFMFLVRGDLFRDSSAAIYSNELLQNVNETQKRFQAYLLSEFGIRINGFLMPAGAFAESLGLVCSATDQIYVLAIHNGHESLPLELFNHILAAIESFQE